MSKTIRKEMAKHYAQLLRRHGMEGDDAKQALDLMGRGYSNAAAIKLTKSRGDHRVLLRGHP
jgi:hypothetical protein